MTDRNDTICAVATPPGRGGVGIIRASGPAAAHIASSLLGAAPKARHAHYARFRDSGGELLDEGLLLYFPAPASFTGEDVVELHGHGGPVVLDRVLQRVLELGGRLARPGEFSERAFLNGKLDLAQAEAIADLIAAGSEESARAAMRSLQGDFSKTIQELVDALIELRVYVESAIDFPDEEIDFLSDGEIETRLATIEVRLADVFKSAQRGQLLRDGMTVVIAGRPNAGKSSLLNGLAGYDAAIVTEIAGTTRDVLREHIHIDGMPLHVIDTAGLRDSVDPVEQEGIRRAWQAIEQADRILLLADDREGLGEVERSILDKLPADIGVTVIRNKIDLSGAPAGINESGDAVEVRLSALTGDGLPLLREHLKTSMGFDGQSGGFLARRRHLDALARAETHLLTGRRQLQIHQAGELLAEDLRRAQAALSEITGEFTSDDLLGEIFSSFCIGK
jgi:tRNA modification GTPase